MRERPLACKHTRKCNGAIDRNETFTLYFIQSFHVLFLRFFFFRSSSLLFFFYSSLTFLFVYDFEIIPSVVHLSVIFSSIAAVAVATSVFFCW